MRHQSGSWALLAIGLAWGCSFSDILGNGETGGGAANGGAAASSASANMAGTSDGGSNSMTEGGALGVAADGGAPASAGRGGTAPILADSGAPSSAGQAGEQGLAGQAGTSANWPSKALELPEIGLGRLGHCDQMRAAWTGSELLVLCSYNVEHTHNNQPTMFEGGVVALRVTPELEVLDVPPVVVTEGPDDPVSAVDVACNGKSCVATWQSKKDQQVHARRLVDAVPGETFELGAGGVDVEPRVVATGIDFLVVWSRQTDSSYALDAARITAAGAALPRTLLASGMSSTQLLAYSGSNYLVLWQPNGESADTVARRFDQNLDGLDPDGVTLGQGRLLDVASDTQGGFAWLHYAGSTLTFQTLASDLSVGAAETIEENAGGGHVQPFLVRGNKQYFVYYHGPAGDSVFVSRRLDAGTWLRANTNISAEWSVVSSSVPVLPKATMVSLPQGGVFLRPGLLGYRLGAAGARVGDEVPLTLAEVELRDGPRLSASKAGYAAIWMTPGVETPTVLRVARYGLDGELLTPQALVLGKLLVGTQSAYNGHTLVVSGETEVGPWQPGIPNGPWHLSAISDSGPGLELYTAADSHLAASEHGFLAVREEEYFDKYAYTSYVRAQRLSATGEVVDTTPLELCIDYGYGEDTTMCGHSPQVASVGDDYLVYWLDDKNALQHFFLVKSNGTFRELTSLPAELDRSEHALLQLLATSDGYVALGTSETANSALVQISTDGDVGPYVDFQMPNRARPLFAEGKSLRYFGLGADGAWLTFLGEGTALGAVDEDVFPAFMHEVHAVSGTPGSVMATWWEDEDGAYPPDPTWNSAHFARFTPPR
ncbi:MAG: hypothetical protein ABUL60_06535 [Myxococcales bacterium]